jgi:phage N-6-adenine-methyltransferase
MIEAMAPPEGEHNGKANTEELSSAGRLADSKSLSTSMILETQPVKTGAAFKRGASRQDYQTPKVFLEAAERRYGKLVIDLAATPENSVAPIFFGEEINSLAQPWNVEKARGWMWLNPPFDTIGPWAAKCAQESKLGARILFLVPNSTGSNWFRDFVFNKCLVLFLNGRLSFDGKNPYPKDLVLCVYDASKPPGFEVWDWRH